MKRLMWMLATVVGLVALAALYQVSMPGGARDQGRPSWFGSLLEPGRAHAAPLEPRTNQTVDLTDGLVSQHWSRRPRPSRRGTRPILLRQCFSSLL